MALKWSDIYSCVRKFWLLRHITRPTKPVIALLSVALFFARIRIILLLLFYLCAASRVEKTGIISQSPVLEKLNVEEKGWPSWRSSTRGQLLSLRMGGHLPPPILLPTAFLKCIHVSKERKGTDCSSNDTVTTGSRLRLSTPKGLRTSKQNTRFCSKIDPFVNSEILILFKRTLYIPIMATLVDSSGKDTMASGTRLRLSTPLGLQTSKQNTELDSLSKLIQ